MRGRVLSLRRQDLRMWPKPIRALSGPNPMLHLLARKSALHNVIPLPIAVVSSTSRPCEGHESSFRESVPGGVFIARAIGTARPVFAPACSTALAPANSRLDTGLEYRRRCNCRSCLRPERSVCLFRQGSVVWVPWQGGTWTSRRISCTGGLGPAKIASALWQRYETSTSRAGFFASTTATTAADAVPFGSPFPA